MPVRLLYGKDAQKAEEFRRIIFLAGTRGGLPKPQPEHLQWPDGFIDDIPVEHVRAFQPALGDDPKRGSSTRRAKTVAARLAQEIESTTGFPAAFGAHDGQPFAIPLDGKHALPIDVRPKQLAEWVLFAVRQKMGKHYDDAQKTILLVDLDWPEMPSSRELKMLGERLAELGCVFKEVWIANAYGDVPQQVPSPTRRP